MDEMNSEQSLDTVQNAPDIWALPEELLLRIMELLSLNDRKTTRLVCKQWNKLSYSYSLIKNEWVELPSMMKLSRKASDHWKFVNLRILRVGHQYKEMRVWERYGSHVNKIELHNFSSQNPVLVDILMFCTNLRYLAVHDSVASENRLVSFAESGVIAPSTLECLKLHNVVNLTDKEFTVLTENANNLTQFYLHKYFFYEVHEQDRRNDRSCLHEIIGNESLSDYDFVKISSLVSFIKRQSQLTHLGITSTYLPEAALVEIFSAIGITLKNLEISINTDHRQDGWIQAISENCADLEVINISSSFVDSEAVSTLFRSLVKVRKITLIEVMTYFNIPLSLSGISNLDLLSEINITNCFTIENQDLLKIGERLRPNIKVLIFNYVRCLNDEAILTISPMVPNIIHWYMSGGSSLIGNDAFNAIVANNKFLQRLSIVDSNTLTTIIPGINELTELQTLNLRLCVNLPRSTISHLSLKKLKTLAVVGLDSECNLKAIADACPNLKDIYLVHPTNKNASRPKIHYGFQVDF